MIYSPLALGEIIHPTDEVYDLVWSVVQRSPKENLARGLLTEYSHNVAYHRAGMAYEPPPDRYAVYDRKVNGVLQDDKLATLRPDGQLSRTHTISIREFEAWVDEPDVIIHSFEEVDDGQNGIRYRGAISFQKLAAEGLLQNSTFDDTVYFDRIKALDLARA